MFELKKRDFDVLKTIAEYKILVSSQITTLLDRNKQSIRRKLALLEKCGHLSTRSQCLGHRRGRPDRLYSITKQGIDALKLQGILPKDAPYEKISAENMSNIDHQMMMNWFWMHLNCLKRILSRIEIKFLSCNSPFLPETKSGHCFITDFVIDAAGKRMFTPDGVFIITDTVKNKSLLFFLEADCGSETLASPERHIKDVRQKIVNYDSYFDNLGYKRYEELWNCKLNGFRLLFVTNAFSRLKNLCRLVRDMPPSDYIWLAHSQSIFKGGVSGKIWIRGGNTESSPQSIIGSLACETPLAEFRQLKVS